MRIKPYLLLIFSNLAICLGASSSAFAQQPLTLEEALELVKTNNLKLLQQGEIQRSADLEVSIAKASRLPSIDFSLNTTYLSKVSKIDVSGVIPLADREITLGGHDRSELMLSIRQPIFTGLRLKTASDIARQKSLSEHAKRQVLLNEVSHLVYVLFYTNQSLINQERILEASATRLSIQLENVRNLFRAAQVMAFDTLQVYNQTIALDIERENLALSQRLLQIQLRQLLNLSEKRAFAVMTLPPPDTSAIDLERLKNDAISQRPELDGIQIARHISGLRRTIDRAEYFPNVFAVGNYHYAKPGLEQVTNKWMDYFSVGINVQWNLWRWGADKNKIQADIALTNKLNLEERELIQTINFEVEQSVENLLFSFQRLRLARKLEAQQKERYRILEVQHRNGVASTNDLVTAETDLRQAELQTQQALIQCYIHQADLASATGSIVRDH